MKPLREYLLTEILQVCAVAQASGQFMDMERIFISLLGCSDAALILIAQKLNIKIPNR